MRVRRITPAVLAAACAASGVAGCRLGASRPESPAERASAVAAWVRSGDRERIPEIIVALNDPDGAVRLVAQRGLIEMTGQDLGYRHADPEPMRAAAIERWAAWAVEQGLAPAGGSTAAASGMPFVGAGEAPEPAEPSAEGAASAESGSGFGAGVTDEGVRDAP